MDEIGTVVLPNADLKYFDSLCPQRAERRFKEFKLLFHYPMVTLEEVEKEIEKDWKDSHREVSPLRPAEDTVIIK